MVPEAALVRSTVASWQTTRRPSAVAWTSSSMPVAPAPSAAADGVQRRRRGLPRPALVGVGDDAPLGPHRARRRSGGPGSGRWGHGRTVASDPPCWTTSSPNSSRRSGTRSRPRSCSVRRWRSGSRSTCSWATSASRRPTASRARSDRRASGSTPASTGRRGARPPTGAGPSATIPTSRPRCWSRSPSGSRDSTGVPGAAPAARHPPRAPGRPGRAARPRSGHDRAGAPRRSGRARVRHRGGLRGLVRLDEALLEDPGALDEAMAPLGRAVASLLVSIGDLPFTFRPIDATED